MKRTDGEIKAGGQGPTRGAGRNAPPRKFVKWETCEGVMEEERDFLAELAKS